MTTRLKSVARHIARKVGLTSRHSAIANFYPPYLTLDGLALDAPIDCTIEVTYQCNLFCDMCPQVAYRLKTLGGKQIKNSRVDGESPVLTTEEIQRVLGELATAGTQSIVFTGGEPFLRPDMCDILEHGKELGLAVHVITNATQITEETARRLVSAGVDELCISLDGPEDIHNEIRGSSHGFQDLCRGVRHINSEKKRQTRLHPELSLSLVIHTLNQRMLAGIVDVAADLEVPTVHLNFPFYTTPDREERTRCILGRDFSMDVKPEVQSKLNMAESIDQKALVESLAHARRVAKDHGILMTVAPDLSENEIDVRFRDPDSSVVKRCFYPWKSMRIDPWGNLYPCSIDIHFGNVREQSPLDLWNGPKYREFRRILKRESLFPKCAKCCVLSDRTWNRLPNLSIPVSDVLHPAIRSLGRITRR